MKPIRVVFIVTGLQTGGAERMLVNLISGMDKQKFAPLVVSLRQHDAMSKPITDCGVPLYVLDMEPSRPTLGSVRKLQQQVQELQPDIIQGWMYHGNLAASLVGPTVSNRPPVCWNIQHSMYGLQHEKPLTMATIVAGVALSSFASQVLYVSEVSRSQHEGIGYASARGQVIPNGVDTALFHPQPESRQHLRAELGLAPDTFLIGLIARFHPQKDHQTFLQAAAQLVSSHPSAHIVLAGRGTDSNNQELAALVHATGVPRNIHLLGERSDMARITAALDIACSTSRFGEALSLALAEALACGVPCTVTDIGDSAQLVGEAGMVVEVGDVSGLVAAWRRLLDAGPVTREALGKLARRRAEQHYSLTSIVRRYESLYETLVSAN